MDALPQLTFNEDVAKLSVSDVARIGFINGVSIGTEYSGDVEALLKYWKETGVNVGIVLGDILYIDQKRHSHKKNERAQLVEDIDNPNEKRIGEIAEKHDLSFSGDYYFIPGEVKFDELIKKLSSAFKDNEIPLVGVLGSREYDILSWLVNEEVRDETYSMRAKIKHLIDELEDQIDELSARKLELNKGHPLKRSLAQKIRWKRKAIEDLSVLLGQTIMTNFSDERRKEIWKKKRGYLISSLEEAIPHLKIVSPSIGEMIVEIGEEKFPVMFSYDFSKLYFSRGLVKLKQVASQIAKNDHNPPFLMVQGGDFSLFEATSIRADEYSPSMFYGHKIFPPKNGGHKYIHLRQISPMLDVSGLEKLLTEFPKIPDKKLTKIKEGFCGASVVEIRRNGLIIDELLFPQYLENLRENKAEITEDLFYGLLHGDEHFGDSFIAMPQDGYLPWVALFYKNIGKVAEELGITLSFCDNLGDLLNGGNYPSWQTVNPLHVPAYSIPDYVEELRQKLKKEGKTSEDIDKAVNIALIRNAMIAPMPDIGEQIGMHRKYTEKYLFYRQFVEGADKIGLLGPVIVFNQGNHEKKTFMEGKGIVDYHPLETIVSSVKLAIDDERVLYPKFGRDSIAHIERAIPNGYKYTFYERHKQVYSGVPDLISAMKKATASRGELVDISVQGHAHMGYFGADRRTLYLVTRSMQDRNEFGENKNLQLPNIGVDILGLPTSGFAYGPVRRIDMDTYYLSKLLGIK